MNFNRFATSIEEDVLVFALQSNFHVEIEEAKNSFYEIIGELDTNHEMIADFNTWLVYDYKGNGSGSFIERYHKSGMVEFTKEENVFINQVKHAYLSLYEVSDRTGDHYQLRDIFTKKELQLPMTRLEDFRDGELILSRIVEVDGSFWPVGSRVYIPTMFRISIERNMINQYEGFKKANSYGTWEAFLKTHSLYLYKYVSIIQDLLVHEVTNEEDYSVWQSIYLIKDSRNMKQILSESKQIKLEDEEEGTLLYRVMTGEGILAEMIIKNNRIELECNSLQDRKKAKKLIESLLESRITHFKDEKISIEDIL